MLNLKDDEGAVRPAALMVMAVLVFTLVAACIKAAEGAGMQTVYSKDVREIAEGALKKCMPQGGFSKIKEIHLPDDFDLPQGRLSWNIDEGKVNPDGRFSMKVQFSVNGREKRTAIVWGRVSVIKKTLIAARPIKRMQVISDDDVVAVDMEKSTFNDGALTAPSDAVGLVASRPLNSGAPVKADDLKPPTVIKRGESVRIIAMASGIKVTAMGLAGEDGVAGGKIKVQNIKSGRVVVGRVVSEGVVEVVF